MTTAVTATAIRTTLNKIRPYSEIDNNRDSDNNNNNSSSNTINNVSRKSQAFTLNIQQPDTPQKVCIQTVNVSRLTFQNR